ncbi:uncharacterized protein LOC133892212 [Phragmites australis]|uniref:uncharacterized protein LOC133892212 n=1 Tax=Phragmites australis TaxID=29695 RepID=UPI002D7768B4|nr:uncharacterized protein LOC133892212 [Phragmites australis]
MIEGIGFGGLLNIRTNVLPIDLTKWVISTFQSETSELVIPGRGRVSVAAETVHKILGLPRGGNKVIYDFDVEAINFIHEEYQIDDGVTPQIKTIVKRLQDNKNADEDYLRSWLMLAVSTFLCPTTCLFISPKCYPALRDLSKVKEFNWCQFVVDSLKTSVHEMQTRNSVKGCLFFLVVLYLDSLAVPNVQIPVKKRMLSHAVSKVCIGITELVGNFLGEVSEIIEGDNPMDQSESTLRRSKRTKISKEDKDNVDETSLDSDYEEEEEYDDEDYESSQDNVSDEVEQDSGADEGRDVEDEELG